MATALDHGRIEQTLKSVRDPIFNQDLVSLGCVQNIDISAQNTVTVSLGWLIPKHPNEADMLSAITNAVGAIPGVQHVVCKTAFKSPEVNRGLSHQGGARAAGVSRIDGVSHIIAVSSGKGGVGKSTVAVNLAVSLAKQGAKVGLMDADVYGPNVPTMMGVTEGPKIVQDPKRGELFIPPTAHGVKVMSMGFLIDVDQPLVWRGPMLHSVMQQFCHQVDWGTLDYLIVDMPPGTGDVQLSLAQMVPMTGSVLVTTPQEVSLQDVRKAYHMFEKVKVPLIGFVENMSYFQPDLNGTKYYIFGQNGGKKIAEKFGKKLLAEFPITPAVREGGDAGRPLVVADPYAPTAQIFDLLATEVATIVARMSLEGIDPVQVVQIGKF